VSLPGVHSAASVRGDVCGTTDPRGRPRQQRLHRSFAGARGGDEPAVRAHQPERRGDASLVCAVGNRADVAVKDRHQPGVERRRQRPFVLPNLWEHRRRQRDRRLDPFLAEQLRDPPFVYRVLEGEQCRHRDTLRVGGREITGQLPHGGLV